MEINAKGVEILGESVREERLMCPTERAKRCVDAKVNLQTQRANTRIDIQSVPVDLTC